MVVSNEYCTVNILRCESKMQLPLMIVIRKRYSYYLSVVKIVQVQYFHKKKKVKFFTGTKKGKFILI